MQEVRGDGQKSHSQGRGLRGELAHGSKAHRYAAYGKCGACALTVRVLTWAEPGREQSSGLFAPGEGLGHWPNAACKATCLACGVDEVSDERPGRAVPETNQALGWGDCPDPKRAKTQSDLPVCTARHAATRGVIKQESAEVIVGSQELKDRTSQSHGGAEQTSACH